MHNDSNAPKLPQKPGAGRSLDHSGPLQIEKSSEGSVEPQDLEVYLTSQATLGTKKSMYHEEDGKTDQSDEECNKPVVEKIRCKPGRKPHTARMSTALTPYEIE